MSQQFEIRQVPLCLDSENRKIDGLLSANGLRRDDFSTYIGVYDMDDNLVGGGGLSDEGVIKCVAINESMRGSGAANALITRLRAEGRHNGHHNLFVFTKPEYKSLFADLAFRPIAWNAEAVMLESDPRGISSYVEGLTRYKHEGRIGAIVMNVNPPTLGHEYLIREAAATVDHLYVFIVAEDKSRFPLAYRRRMLRSIVDRLDNVTLLDTGPYAISAATFPSYFLKKIDSATDVSIRLDLDIFIRHIVPALDISVRFAGTEPQDELTYRYNRLMAEILPSHGVEFREIPRIQIEDEPVSASRVRRLLDDGQGLCAMRLAGKPESYLPWIARTALYRELDLTPKPGLVDKADSGSHTDMDYALMARSIETVAYGMFDVVGMDSDDADSLRGIGIDIEKNMLQTTGGINTHRGAIFAMGLTLFAASRLLRRGFPDIDSDILSAEIAKIAEHTWGMAGSHGEEAVRKYNANGAVANAAGGYRKLFDSWLPFYRAHRNDADRDYRLLLTIICDLDDTNVLHRAGREGATWLKSEASRLLDDFTVDGMRMLNEQCVARDISPGGAADMMALTFLIDSITI